MLHNVFWHIQVRERRGILVPHLTSRYILITIFYILEYSITVRPVTKHTSWDQIYVNVCLEHLEKNSNKT